VCFQTGSMRIVSLGVWFLWVWYSLYMVCSRAVVSSGRDMGVPVHDVSMSGIEENIVFSGFSE
jgi:hypothetical protein